MVMKSDDLYSILNEIVTNIHIVLKTRLRSVSKHGGKHKSVAKLYSYLWVVSSITFGFFKRNDEKKSSASLGTNEKKNKGYKTLRKKLRWIIFLVKGAGRLKNKQKLSGDLFIISVFIELHWIPDIMFLISS